MVPHPPILVSEVGKGEEKKAQATLDALDKVGAEIARLKPDTIIISSPHAEAYADYFQISDGEIVTGSFSQFGAPGVTFRCQYDFELVERISLLAKKQSFPAGSEGNDERYLDHGTMVPLYFINKHYTSYRLVRVGLSGLSNIDHYRFGEIIKKACDEEDKRVVYLASGDLSHCQKEDGPYGFKPEGPAYDQKIMQVMGTASFGDLFTFDPAFLDSAEECGHRSFAIMAGALDRTAVSSQALSHEAPFGIGYGVCEYLVTGPDETRNYAETYYSKMTLEMKKKREAADPYVKLAYAALDAYVKNGTTLSSEGVLPEISSQKAGAFVSIHEFGQLRGCIGTTAPTQDDLAKEIIMNAISAASEDPRFDAIEARELPYLEVSVDVLSPYEEIKDLTELNPKKYGVIVENNGRRGLLLPDLPGVETEDDQIAIAKKKAGIAPDESVKIYRFTVVRHL